MKDRERPTQFAVIGLGRFGRSVVKALASYGVDILACDSSEENLRAVADYATHAVQIDAGDEEALKKLGIGNFDVVVLAMGEDFQASILATMTAKEQGAKCLIVKAYGKREKKVFERLGADMVIVPELEMGEKLAHRLIRPNLLDILGDSENSQIVEMRPLAEWVGKSVKESNIRKNYGTSLLAIIRGDETIIPVMPEEVLLAGDVLVTLGAPPV